MAKYDHIYYPALTNPVVRIVRVKDGKQWDDANQAMAEAPTYADTAIELTRIAAINGIPIEVPAAMPSGDFDMLIYDAASPANTDVFVRWYRIEWAGKNIIGTPRDMGVMA